MDESGTSKELVLTAPTEAVVRRSKPSLMQMGNRYLSSDAKWHPSLAVEYVLGHARARWLPVGELARTFFGANIPTTKKKVRRRIPALFGRLLDQNFLLVTEVDGQSNRVLAVKLYDPRSDEDRQGLRAKLERMRQRKEVTAAQFERAVLLTAMDEPRDNEPTTQHEQQTR